jgi:hypothetical protein
MFQKLVPRGKNLRLIGIRHYDKYYYPIDSEGGRLNNNTDAFSLYNHARRVVSGSFGHQL